MVFTLSHGDDVVVTGGVADFVTPDGEVYLTVAVDEVAVSPETLELMIWSSELPAYPTTYKLLHA